MKDGNRTRISLFHRQEHLVLYATFTIENTVPWSGVEPLYPEELQLIQVVKTQFHFPTCKQYSLHIVSRQKSGGLDPSLSRPVQPAIELMFPSRIRTVCAHLVLALDTGTLKLVVGNGIEPFGGCYPISAHDTEPTQPTIVWWNPPESNGDLLGFNQARHTRITPGFHYLVRMKRFELLDLTLSTSEVCQFPSHAHSIWYSRKESNLC